MNNAGKELFHFALSEMLSDDVLPHSQYDMLMESDIVIVEQGKLSKVMITAPYATMAYQFNRDTFARENNLHSVPGSLDVLYNSPTNELLKVWLTKEIVTIDDVADRLVHYIFELRRDGDIQKADARYLYGEVREVSESVKEGLSDLEFGEEDYRIKVNEMVDFLVTLNIGGESLFSLVGSEHISAILMDFEASEIACRVVNYGIVKPLRSELKKSGAKPLTSLGKKPVLTIVG